MKKKEKRGVILAGGFGTRLMPLTKVTNKHLLPVFNKPMIYYPLNSLLKSGIKKILIITGPEYSGDFLRLLGSGKEFNAEFTYKIQDKAKGIADAIRLAEDFVGKQKFVTILGDNIFEDNLEKEINSFFESGYGMKVMLKKVKNNYRFGVPELKGKKIVGFEEKPKKPKSPFAATGIYMLDKQVFKIIPKLKLSWRKEYEITDVMNYYLKQGMLTYGVLKGFWSDAGTIESLYHATKYMKKLSLKKGQPFLQ